MLNMTTEKEWDELARYLINAVKASLDYDQASVYWAEVKKERRLPYVRIKFDQKLYHEWVERRNKLVGEGVKKDVSMQLKREDADISDLERKIADYDKGIAVFDKFASSLELLGIETKKEEVNGIINYSLYLTPKELDALMFSHHSLKYVGYRDGASVLLLENPNVPPNVEGVILLSPVVLLDDNTMLLRSAGCNTSNLISVQLAYLLEQYVPRADQKAAFSTMYGHELSPLTEDELGITANMVFVAMEKCLGLTEVIHHQSDEGTRVLKPCKSYSVQPLTEESKRIYRIFGATDSAELDLQVYGSAETSTICFLDKLIEVMNFNILMLQEELAEQDEDIDDEYISNLNCTIKKLTDGIATIGKLKAHLPYVVVFIEKNENLNDIMATLSGAQIGKSATAVFEKTQGKNKNLAEILTNNKIAIKDRTIYVIPDALYEEASNLMRLEKRPNF